MMDDLSQPPPKKAKRECHFDSKWIQEFPGIGLSSKGKVLDNNYIVLFEKFIPNR